MEIEKDLVDEEDLSEIEETPVNKPSMVEELGYDNEWVRFLYALSKDSSLSPILRYIESSFLTSKAKRKIMIYTLLLLDKEFAVSRLVKGNDFMFIVDDRDLIDADLYLGLTRFDITPDFLHIINMVRIKFAIKTRRSIGGFERKIIATHRTEVSNERVEEEEKDKKSIWDTFR